MTLSDETHERIDAIHRESAQRALAAEIITITVLQRAVDEATKGLVFNVATTTQKLKLAGPQLVRQASEQLQRAATEQATFALGHARNLALMQVHREAAEAAAIVKQLTGADVDLSVLKRIMLSPELDATRAASAASSIAGQFSRQAAGEVALAGLRETSTSDLAKKLAAMGKAAPITTAIEGNATTISFTSYGGAHAQAWKDLADDGTGDEELLPHGWASGMMKVWSAVLDRKTCPTCYALDGTMVPVDKPFPQHVHPPAHVRCRCIECALFVPEKLAKKLPGIGIDYAQLKEDVRDYMRGSSIKIGEGKRHAEEYIREALKGTSPEALTRRLIDRDYFVTPPKMKPPKPGPMLPQPKPPEPPKPRPEPKAKPQSKPKPSGIDAIDQALGKQWASEQAALVAADLNVARGAVRELLDGTGMVSKDVAQGRAQLGVMRVAKAEDMPGADAWHATLDGHVQVREDVATGFKGAMQGLGSGRLVSKQQELNGLRVVLHEEIHGYSAIAGAGYSLAGQAVEEAATELLARDVAERITGVSLPRWTVAYRAWVDKFVEAFATSGELTLAEARTVATRAVVATRSNATAVWSKPDDQAEDLSKAVKSLGFSDAQSAALQRKLTNLQYWGDP